MLRSQVILGIPSTTNLNIHKKCGYQRAERSPRWFYPLPLTMKSALLVSVLVNTVLVAGVLFLWHRLSPMETSSVGASFNTSLGTHTGNGTADISNAALDQARARFHWSQVESTVYRTYVANLRS